MLTLALPFGLRSAPYIFNAVAEAVEWILVNSYKVPDLLHYLYDFITAGPPDSPQCAHNLSYILYFISSLQALGLTSSSWQLPGDPCWASSWILLPK